MENLMFHPKLVHLPIALAVLMPLLSAGLWLAWRRGWLPARGWAIAVGLQLVLVGSGVLALRSGEAEEDRVEAVVPEAAIEAHEEAAETFVVASGLVLGVMALGLALSRGRAGRPIAALGVVGTLLVFGLGYRTGEAGGALVYQHGAAAAYSGAAGSQAALPGDPERGGHDDDD